MGFRNPLQCSAFRLDLMTLLGDSPFKENSSPFSDAPVMMIQQLGTE